METGRVRSIQAMAALLVAMAGCSSSPTGPVYPEAIDFGAQHLTKATTWARGGISGIVYVPPGEKLPAASLQVGAIISSEHTTANGLHGWVDEQFIRSGELMLHQSGAGDESCKVGVSAIGTPGMRTYMTLQVCKTGVARAACVEADEKLDDGVATTCMNQSRCFEDVCDMRWRGRRESLDLLVVDVLTLR